MAIPKLEQLSKVVDSVSDKIQEKVLEIEQEHNINTRQRMVMVDEMKETFKGSKDEKTGTEGGQDYPMDYEKKD